jgi:hypothetical protein
VCESLQSGWNFNTSNFRSRQQSVNSAKATKSDYANRACTSACAAPRKFNSLADTAACCRQLHSLFAQNQAQQPLFYIPTGQISAMTMVRVMTLLNTSCSNLARAGADREMLGRSRCKGCYPSRLQGRIHKQQYSRQGRICRIGRERSPQLAWLGWGY